MKVEIQALHFQADHKLKEFIVRKLEKLETFYDRIIDSNVTLSLEHNGANVKDKVAVIKLAIPGSVLVAKEKRKIFEEAIDLCVESLKRQLTKHKDKMRQHV